MEIPKEQLDEFVHYLQSLTETGFVHWRVSKGPLGNEFVAEICAVITEEPGEDESVTLKLFNTNYDGILDAFDENKVRKPLDHDVGSEDVKQLLASVKTIMKSTN